MTFNKINLDLSKLKNQPKYNVDSTKKYNRASVEIKFFDIDTVTDYSIKEGDPAEVFSLIKDIFAEHIVNSGAQESTKSSSVIEDISNDTKDASRNRKREIEAEKVETEEENTEVTEIPSDVADETASEVIEETPDLTSKELEEISAEQQRRAEEEEGQIAMEAANRAIEEANRKAEETKTELVNSVLVPSDLKQTGMCANNTSYTDYAEKWTWRQGQLYQSWEAAGSQSDGTLAMMNGRYMVAVSPKFGQVGDNINVVLKDGTVIPCVIADCKGGDATSEYGHVLGNSGVDVVEWETVLSNKGGNDGNVRSAIKEDCKNNGWYGVGVDRIDNLGDGSYF